MADDIVTRLRSLGTERAIDCGPGVRWEPFPWAQQAADEIERLRRRLAALEDWAFDEWPLKYMTPEERESTLLEMEASLEARRG